MRFGNTDVNAAQQNFDVRAKIPQVPLAKFDMVGVVHKDLTNRVTTTTNATALQTVSLAANALKENGRGLRWTLSGSHAATADTALLTAKLGATELYNSTALALNAKTFDLQVEIHRVSQSVLRSVVRGAINGAVIAPLIQDLTENCANALALTFNCTDANNAGGTTLKSSTLESI